MYCSILICHAVFVAIAFPPCVLFFLPSSFWLVFYFPSLLCCICVCKGLCGALHLPLSWIHSNQCAHLWFKRSILCSMPLSAVIARLSFLTAAVVVMLRPCTLSMSFGWNQLNSVMVRLTNAFPACPPKLPLVSLSTATEEWWESHLPTLTQAATPHTICRCHQSSVCLSALWVCTLFLQRAIASTYSYLSIHTKSLFWVTANLSMFVLPFGSRNSYHLNAWTQVIAGSVGFFL